MILPEVPFRLVGRASGGYFLGMSVVVKWNGKDLPAELAPLPAGRYVIEPVDDPPTLTAEEERGLEEALASLRDGRGIDGTDVRRRIEDLVDR